jgi:hypothetical protein
MTGERLVWEGRPPEPPPITLDVTCSRCWRIFRFDVLVTTVVAQLLADEGWSFPGEADQLCPKCQK